MSYFVFWDIGSGGKLKSAHKFYFVETNHGLEHAIEIFSWETKLDPYKVSCECCGKDFIIVLVENPLDFFDEVIKRHKNESVKFLNFSSFKI